MAISAGTVEVEVVPSFSNFGRRISRDVDGAMRPVEQGISRSVDATGKHVESRLGGSFRNAFSSVGPIARSAAGDLLPLSGAFAGVSGAMDSTRASGSRVGPALMGVGAAATGAGVMLTKMGDESKRATDQLRVAIENSGASMDQFEPRISKVSDRLIKLGFDDEATARSLATLTTATQDTGKAIDLMALAADIAAARHISLESATDKLVKMQAGNLRVFKEFGIQVGANATAAERAAAMTELQSRVQGQAAAQADNFTGRMKSLAIQAENVGEMVGEKVGPALTVVGPLMAGIGGVIQAQLIPSLAAARVAFTNLLTVMGPVGLALAAGALAQSLSSTTGQMQKLANVADHELLPAFNRIVEKAESSITGFFFDLLGSKADTAKEKFQQLAEQSPETARRLVEAMRAAGQDTTQFDIILGKLRTQHQGVVLDAQGNAVATDVMAEAQKRASAAVQDLTTKLQALVGVHVTESQAAITFQANLAAATTKLQENGTTLDITTAKGRENKGAIDSMVQGITGHIDALGREGATMDEIRGNFDRHIEDFRRTLRAAGFTEAQIESLIAEYKLVPGTVETTLKVYGEAEYSRALASAKQMAEETWRVVGVTPGAGKIVMGKVPERATGGTIPASPIGPGFVTNGPRAIVGEGSSTHPEYVIPTDPKYRQRATGLFMSLGDELRLMAAGGRLSNEISTDIGPAGRALAERMRAELDRRMPEGPAPGGATPGVAAGTGPRVGGLTAMASGMVHAVLQRFPGQRMTSGYRSPAENARVGGAKNSDHMYGRAADFAPGSNAVASFLRGYPGIKQVIWQAPGHYDHVHGATVADTGAILSPGHNVLDNRTGGPETLVNADLIDYDRLAAALANVHLSVAVDKYERTKTGAMRAYR